MSSTTVTSTSSVANDEELLLDTEMLAAEGVSLDASSAAFTPYPSAADMARARANSGPAKLMADGDDADAAVGGDISDDAAAPAAAPRKGGAAKTSATAAPAERPTAANLIARLDAMLQRSAQFRDIAIASALKDSKDKAAAESKTKRGASAKKGGERVRMTEDEEDKAMLAEAEAEAAGAASASVGRILVQPSIITATMRPYQLEALNWLMRLHDSQLNGILADEMGLGKTLETISLLAYLREFRGINGRHMIIVPKSTLTNWTREVRKWCPAFSVLAFHGPREDREALIPQLAGADVIVTTYEVCIIERAALRALALEYIIIDEAHRIKNENSKLALVVRQFKSAHRLLITGTPLQNNLHELWSLLNFLKPDLFSSHADFEEFFNLSAANSDVESDAMVKSLHRVLRPFLLRRLKSEVATSLPPKEEVHLHVGLSAMQREYYTRILARDIDALNANAANSSKTQLQNIMMQLRKVCNHPYLFEGAEPGPPFIEGEHLVENCGKMILLDKLLAKLKRDGSRVLIFSQMTRMLDILEDYCNYRDLTYCRIDGSTKQTDRDDAMDAFNAPDSDKFVFLLSTHAGGLGINLQTADTVILYDSDWNPQMDLQAQDRAHRIGQKKQVRVFRFVTQPSVEEKIVARATRKLALDALIIQKGRLAEQESKGASAAELQNMVRFGAAFIFSSKDATITDDDIDTILSRGKQQTEEQAAKLKATSSDSLLNFSFVANEEDGFKVQTFEGVDYAAAAAANAADSSGLGLGGGALPFIAPPQRERKTGGYDVNEYYRTALNPNAGETKARAGPREWRPAQRHDFQFFAVERLNALEKRHFVADQAYKAARIERLRAVKERRKAELDAERDARRAKAQAERAAGREVDDDDDDDEDEDESDIDLDEEDEDAQLPSPNAASSSAASAGSASSSAASPSAAGGKKRALEAETEGDAAAATQPKPAAPAAPTSSHSKNATRAALGSVTLTAEDEEELRRNAGCLTAEEEQEMRTLQAEGFPDWRKADTQHFVTACATFGRRDVARIAAAVEGKDPADVRRYHAVFWRRVGELKDADRLVKQVERGEAIVQRRKAIEKLLDLKVARSGDPVTALKLDYPSKQTLYTAEEDRFLVLAMRHQGFGNWDAIRRDVLLAPQLRFDWFLKSRTTWELAKRCEFLLKLLEKEVEKPAVAAVSAAAAAATAGPGSASAAKGRGNAQTDSKVDGKAEAKPRARPAKKDKDGAAPAAEKKEKASTPAKKDTTKDAKSAKDGKDSKTAKSATPTKSKTAAKKGGKASAEAEDDEGESSGVEVVSDSESGSGSGSGSEDDESGSDADEDAKTPAKGGRGKAASPAAAAKGGKKESSPAAKKTSRK